MKDGRSQQDDPPNYAHRASTRPRDGNGLIQTVCFRNGRPHNLHCEYWHGPLYTTDPLHDLFVSYELKHIAENFASLSRNPIR